MLFLGVAVGSPIFGVLYRSAVSHRFVMSASAFFSGCISVWIIYFTPGVMLGAGLFFFLGVICCGYVMSYPLAADSVSMVDRSTSLGFTNMLGVALAPVMQVCIGFFIKEYGHEYTALSYQSGLKLVPIVAFLAAIVAFWLPNKEEIN